MKPKVDPYLHCFVQKMPANPSFSIVAMDSQAKHVDDHVRVGMLFKEFRRKEMLSANHFHFGMDLCVRHAFEVVLESLLFHLVIATSNN